MIASLLILAAVVGIASPTPSPQPSATPESVENHSPPESHASVAAPHSPSVSEKRSEEWESAEQRNYRRKHLFLARLKEYETVINLCCAIVVALFTGILTLFTVKMWRSGKEHSERELRAYIQVSKACITYISPDMCPEAVLNIKNYGQTPAYNCRTSLTIAVRDFPGSDFHLAEQLPDTSGIAPGEFYECRISFQSILTQTGYTDILTGKKAIYVLTQTLYRDVFGKEQVSNYRGFFRGGYPDDPSRHHDLLRALNKEPLALIRTQEGNDCT